MMKKAGFIILFVAILFGLSKPPTFALTEQVTHAVPTVPSTEVKNENRKDEPKKESQVALPVEVPVTITVPTVVPTIIPLPTVVPLTPTATVTPAPTRAVSPTPTHTPVANTGNTTGGSSSSNTSATNTTATKAEEKPANPTTTTSLQTAATAVTKNTVKKTVPKTPQNKPSVAATKVGNIIVPTISSDVKVKGANYYIDEKLSKDTTMALISFSFFLFIMGVGILNVPNFIRSIADIRRKNAAHKTEHSFTIRYLDL